MKSAQSCSHLPQMLRQQQKLGMKRLLNDRQRQQRVMAGEIPHHHRHQMSPVISVAVVVERVKAVVEEQVAVVVAAVVVAAVAEAVVAVAEVAVAVSVMQSVRILLILVSPRTGKPRPLP